MSVDGSTESSGGTPPLPTSIWVVAWSSLIGQVLVLAGQLRELDDQVSLVVSVVVGGLLVGYVSAGVVRARTVRLVLAWVVLLVTALAEIVALVLVDDPEAAVVAVLSIATTASALAGLAAFHRTDWYAWQRTRPPTRVGAPIGRLVAVGVLVGILGGLIGPVEQGSVLRSPGPHARVRV